MLFKRVHFCSIHTAHINYNNDNNNVVNDGMVYVTVGPRYPMQLNPDHIPLAAHPLRENSPYNNSSSEKESTSSSTTFRTNHGNSICFFVVVYLNIFRNSSCCVYPFSHWHICLHCYYFGPNDG